MTWTQNRAGVVVEDDARADKAWRLRVAGGTWREVAELSGYSDASNARRAVTRRHGTLPEVSRKALRDLWRERLEVLWRQTVADVHDRQPGALVAGVRIVQTAAQLDGLNAPVRVDVNAETALSVIVARLTGRPLEDDDDDDRDVIEAATIDGKD